MTPERIVIGNAELWHGDCIEVMASMADKSVSAVITDPPYEAEAHTKGRRLRSKQAGGARTVEYCALDFASISDEIRIFSSDHMARLSAGWLLTFCQAEAVAAWRDAHEQASAKYKRAMVWIKPDGAPQFTGDRPGMGYESVVASWCGAGRHGVFTHAQRDGNFCKEHMTQKPIALMNELVGLFSNADDIILDPFMGSGTTGVAAIGGGRRFIGIELERKHFDTACRRLEREQQQERLFA